MSQKFLVVNPWIHGNIKPVYSGKNQLDAANKAYEDISQYFGNNNPEFLFSLQKVKSKNDIGNGKNSDYYHFQVNEKRGTQNNKAIKFNLQEINFTKKDNKSLTSFKKDLKKTIVDIKKDNTSEQLGGVWFDDDDDDDDWIYNIYSYPKYRNMSQFYGYYYSPYLYNRFFSSRYFSIPTFAPTIHPYIYINSGPKEPIPLR
jgi:hypothetical protein